MEQECLWDPHGPCGSESSAVVETQLPKRLRSDDGCKGVGSDDDQPIVKPISAEEINSSCDEKLPADVVKSEHSIGLADAMAVNMGNAGVPNKVKEEMKYLQPVGCKKEGKKTVVQKARAIDQGVGTPITKAKQKLAMKKAAFGEIFTCSQWCGVGG